MERIFQVDQKRNPFPYHPLLFAVYPILALIATNLEENPFNVGLRSLVVALILGAMLFFANQLIFRDLKKAALTSTLMLFLLLSYGQVYAAIKQINVFGIEIGRHRYLFAVWAGLFALGITYIHKWANRLDTASRFVNIVGIMSLVFPITSIASSYFSIWSTDWEPSEGEVSSGIIYPLPDVYYIILDGYSRDDVLLEFYEYDNGEFLDSLNERGFYIANCSQSNYPKTRYSITSSLNFNYLSDMEVHSSKDIWKMLKQLEENKVMQIFSTELGYTTYRFETGFRWVDMPRANVVLSFQDSESIPNPYLLKLFGPITNFELLTLRTTLALPFLGQSQVGMAGIRDSGAGDVIRIEDIPRQKHFDQINFILDSLEVFGKQPGNKFVYAHVLIPHGPYVFGPDGEMLTVEDEQNISDEAGYVGQIRYLNQRLIDIIDTLITDSETMPIIVLQADHAGPATRLIPERMNIFSAYYLPHVGDERLYPQITPVNTFRLIFDSYFGTNIGLKEDISYFANYEDFFDFSVHPDKREGCNMR